MIELDFLFALSFGGNHILVGHISLSVPLQEIWPIRLLRKLSKSLVNCQ